MRCAEQGSSPGPSTMRPQRGSRATSSIGAKVMASPSAAASTAASRAERLPVAGSKVEASASGIGNMVRWPWTTSKPISSGIPRRDSSTAMRCRVAHVRGADQVEQVAERASCGSDSVESSPDKPGRSPHSPPRSWSAGRAFRPASSRRADRLCGSSRSSRAPRYTARAVVDKVALPLVPENRQFSNDQFPDALSKRSQAR